MDTLIIVDLQNDFCPGGALPAPEGNNIVPVINNIMDKFDLVIASRDVHPRDTSHFEKWPPHCIVGSWGTNFHPELNTIKIVKELLKGTGKTDDGYSAFEATNENLVEFLKDNETTGLYVTGLTTEYCVKNTVLDSIKNGFKTYIIEDAIAAVEPGSEKEKKSIQEMKTSGTIFLRTDNL
jgi:nicotinamidase/pyrazinamidase